MAATAPAPTNDPAPAAQAPAAAAGPGVLSDDLKIEPASATFGTEQQMSSDMQMCNQTDKRLAVKVKCSNNDAYRVRPVYSFLPPKGQAKLHVTRLAKKPAKVDRLIIQFLPDEAGATPQAVFQAAGTKTLPPYTKVLLTAIAGAAPAAADPPKGTDKKEKSLVADVPAAAADKEKDKKKDAAPADKDEKKDAPAADKDQKKDAPAADKDQKKDAAPAPAADKDKDKDKKKDEAKPSAK